MKPRHTGLDVSGFEPVKSCLSRFADRDLCFDLLARFKRGQDMTRRVGRPSADPHTQAREAIGTHSVDERAHTVVPSVAAMRTNPQPAEIQIQLVVDNEDGGWLKGETRNQRGDGISRGIHEGERFDEPEGLALSSKGEAAQLGGMFRWRGRFGR